MQFFTTRLLNAFFSVPGKFWSFVPAPAARKWMFLLDATPVPVQFWMVRPSTMMLPRVSTAPLSRSVTADCSEESNAMPSIVTFSSAR